MADKTSTVTLKVDLDCSRCYKKISKTICKLQERESIQSITFDVKKNTVTIAGPFDTKIVCSKLCCKAGNVIREIQIKDDKASAKEDKPKPAEPAKKDKPKEDKTKPAEQGPAEPKKKEDDKPKEKAGKDVKEAKPKDEEPKKYEMYPPGPGLVWTEPAYMNQHAVLGYHQPPWSGPVSGEGYGWVQPHGQPPVVYGTPVFAPTYGAYPTQEYFSEEDAQSCTVM